jgi:hypothetical protein
MLTTDIGKRIELVSMDPHCLNISIALYLQDRGRGPEFLVHTYSPRPEAMERIRFICKGMATLGGMEFLQDGSSRVRFPCHGDHLKACRRVFLEVCKLPNGSPLASKELLIFDKKSNRTIRVISGLGCTYELTADGPDNEEKPLRISAVAQGLTKLAELRVEGQDSNQLSFPCGQRHDSLIGLLLGRALNVRAVLREQELAASKGILAPPSAQNQSMNL